jgi:hypothetical protein
MKHLANYDEYTYETLLDGHTLLPGTNASSCEEGL